MLIHFGHSAATSIPKLTQFEMIHSASWLKRNPRPAKKVPALAPALNEFSWIVKTSSKGFHRYAQYIFSAAEVMRMPQMAVAQIVIGAVTNRPKSAELRVLA